MHSLQPNRTIPHPPKPANRLPRRSRTLPSLAATLLLVGRAPERAACELLCEGPGVDGVGIGAELEFQSWARGAEER